MKKIWILTNQDNEFFAAIEFRKNVIAHLEKEMAEMNKDAGPLDPVYGIREKQTIIDVIDEDNNIETRATLTELN